MANIVDAVVVANAINNGEEVGSWDLCFKLRKDGIGLALCYKTNPLSLRNCRRSRYPIRAKAEVDGG